MRVLGLTATVGTALLAPLCFISAADAERSMRAGDLAAACSMVLPPLLLQAGTGVDTSVVHVIEPETNPGSTTSTSTSGPPPRVVGVAQAVPVEPSALQWALCGTTKKWLEGHAARLLDVMKGLMGNDQRRLDEYLREEGTNVPTLTKIWKRTERIAALSAK